MTPVSTGRIRSTAVLVRALGLALVSAPIAAPAWAGGGGLELVPHWPTFIALLALFVVLVAPLDRLLFRPLFRVLEQREEKIEGARRRAERLAAEAEQVIERYRSQVRAVRDEAERDRKLELGEALAEQAAATARARSEAESQLARARDEVGRALEEARAGLRASAEQLARDAAERVLGRALS